VGDGAPDGGEDAKFDGDDDGDPLCRSTPCDLDTQCGCGDGEACDLDASQFASAGTECRRADQGGQNQSACSAPEDCAPGYSCFGSPGQCRKYCDADGECGFGYCAIQAAYDAGGETAEVPGASLCTKACKPESGSGSGCPDDFGCYFYHRDPNGAPQSGDEYWYTDCRIAAATGGRHDATCSVRGDSDCAPGYNCLRITYTSSDGSSRTEHRCRQTCVWTVNGQPGSRTCAGGRVCRQLNDVVVGDTEYGSCGAP
jgi:hypothetical protein